MHIFFYCRQVLILFSNIRLTFFFSLTSNYAKFLTLQPFPQILPKKLYLIFFTEEGGDVFIYIFLETTFFCWNPLLFCCWSLLVSSYCISFIVLYPSYGTCSDSLGTKFEIFSSLPYCIDPPPSIINSSLLIVKLIVSAEQKQSRSSRFFFRQFLTWGGVVIENSNFDGYSKFKKNLQ